ncbi:MAG: hypothetical protein KJ645_06725, partial [Planctomycetes bacterium]|nr:hypothetical protein [Planctomycetota bacterium]
MSLSKKIFMITLVLFVVAVAVMQATNYYLVNSSSVQVIDQIKKSSDQACEHVAKDLMAINQYFAKDLIHEIKIAVGGALQPGESSKFLHLAKKQTELEELQEFSFYGPDGRLELSSNPDTERTNVPEDVWQEGRDTGLMVMRGVEDSATTLRFYDPLFVDADMGRTRGSRSQVPPGQSRGIQTLDPRLRRPG